MKKTLVSENININIVSEEGNKGIFELTGLYKGYGLTLGTAIRRVLLSSLAGVAITQVKITGVGHEFTTIDGVLEDIVEISLNLKKVRFRSDDPQAGYEEPVILTLKKKGEGAVTAGDIKGTSLLEVTNKDLHLATITQKGVELEMELTIEKGLGYVSKEDLKAERLPVGTIQLDALFSPVKNVNFNVENMRVGDQTDFNKLNISIETDGGLTPKEALAKGINILEEQFQKIGNQLSEKVTEEKE